MNRTVYPILPPVSRIGKRATITWRLLSGWMLLAACAVALLSLALTPLAAAQPDSSSARLQWVILDSDNQTVPCRIHLRDAQGKPVQPPELPFWKDHFVCAGSIAIDLAPDNYTYQIERGSEYYAATGAVRLVSGETRFLTNTLRRLANLASEGWWSGETHVHRPPSDIELLMRAEDLHVAPVITWWNDSNRWSRQPRPSDPLVRFDGDRFYHLMAGEDERGGGALLYFNLREPLNITGAQREYPSSTKFLAEARRHKGVWVEIEKPFWWDTPIWLASGQVDSVGIAQNHLQRSGVLDNEAWGKPRNRERYPGPHGNGLWTQDIYYHILNCGLRLPPSAGSASGVLPNPLGYNRVYVHLDGELTHPKWWEGLRAGRVFVSNGPLLRCRANGQLPGHVFKSNEPLMVRIEGHLDSRDPVASVELVHNGRVEPINLPYRFTVEQSGWFLVRAIADVKPTFRFASTGPFYVEIGAQSHPVQRESAQFFLDWTRERMRQLQLDDPQQRAEVLAPMQAAEKFWMAKSQVEKPNEQGGAGLGVPPSGGTTNLSVHTTSKNAEGARKTVLTGEVVDEATKQIIPSRLYIQREDGRWFFPESTAPEGSALRYEHRNWANTNAVEYHTTLSAHPFRIELEPGNYTFTAERGKEYRPFTQRVEIGAEPLTVRLPLHRWVNMAARGWYSGDTHVHRTLAELPNVMLAEDLNVAFPLTFWVTKAFAPPTQGDKNTDAGASPQLMTVDATHVVWPRNTEYEIFTVKGKRHTLGAVFALNHKIPFRMGAPPVIPVAGQAKLEGALLDLDKHDWPWSMALVPLMGVDLYELANNHHWRTEFSMTNWSTPAPDWMHLPNAGRHGTERDWTLYTFQNYYALLNCGFRLRPTAGTANGVHPVPLGFSRVYVQLPGGFSYDAWVKRFNEGRSFVTTGPMLLVKIDNQLPGFKFTARPNKTRRIRVEGTVLSEQPVEIIEVILNGQVAHRLTPEGHRNADGAYESSFRQIGDLTGSGWVAVRCWEPRPNNRIRFAHTAPSFFDVPGQPLPPRSEEVAFLIQRVQQEIERSAGTLPPEAIDEYRQALAVYEALARTAR